VLAAVNLLWNVIEDALGAGLLRDVPPKPSPGDGGSTQYVLTCVVLRLLALVLLVWLLNGVMR
jgi:hypothetical protein